LDEGPFSKGDIFILDGNVSEFYKYKKTAGTVDKDDNVTITIRTLMDGGNRTVTLYRLCDPDGLGTSTFADCTIGGKPTCNCTGIPDLEFRKIALYDAMDDFDPGKYERDDDVTLKPKDLFWANDAGTGQNLVMWFDEAVNVIFYATDENDRWITIEPKMVNPGANMTNDTYKIKSPNIKMWTIRECDFQNDVNATSLNLTCDLNYDTNDDDLLFIFESGNEYVVLDLTDRGYNEAEY